MSKKVPPNAEGRKGGLQAGQTTSEHSDRTSSSAAVEATTSAVAGTANGSVGSESNSQDRAEANPKLDLLGLDEDSLTELGTMPGSLMIEPDVDNNPARSEQADVGTSRVEDNDQTRELYDGANTCAPRRPNSRHPSVNVGLRSDPGPRLESGSTLSETLHTDESEAAGIPEKDKSGTSDVEKSKH